MYRVYKGREKQNVYKKIFFPLFIVYFENSWYETEKPELVFWWKCFVKFFIDPQSLFDLTILSIFSKFSNLFSNFNSNQII